MLHRIPRLAPDLRLVSLDGSTDYLVELPGSTKQVKLGAAAVFLLMLADGKASVENIKRRADKVDVGPPPGFVEQMFGALEPVGVVRWVEPRDFPHQILPGSTTTCEACGRSCMGHMIGPLGESEVDTIIELYDDLEQRVPRLVNLSPIVEMRDKGGFHVNLEEGRCVFVAEDGLCEIHRHVGYAEKPAICKTFPIVRTYTETGVRLGINTSCFRTHQQFERSLGAPSEEALTGDLAALPGFSIYAAPFDEVPLLVPSKERSRNKLRFLETEERVLAYLGGESATLGGLASLMLGKGARSAKQGDLVLGAKTLRSTQAHVGRFLQAVDYPDHFLSYLLRSEGPLPATYRLWKDDLDRFVASSPGPIEVPRRFEVYLLDALRRMIWLRDVLHFQTPVHAVAAFVLGWAAAVSSTAELDPVGWYDRAGEHFTAWYRLIKEDDMHRGLFGSPEAVHGYLETVTAR